MQPIDVVKFLAQNRGLIICLSVKFKVDVEDVVQMVALALLEHGHKWNSARSKLSTFILFKVRKALSAHRPGLGFGGDGEDDGEEVELAAPEPEQIEAWRGFIGDEAFEARLDALREDGVEEVARRGKVGKRQGRNIINANAEHLSQGDLFLEDEVEK